MTMNPIIIAIINRYYLVAPFAFIKGHVWDPQSIRGALARILGLLAMRKNFKLIQY
jgi:hypothetical protein